MLLIDLRNKNITGNVAEKVLGEVNITINKNSIPNDPEKPTITSGIRLGTPAITTRGFKENEVFQLGNMIADIIENHDNIEIMTKIKKDVINLCNQFPVYNY